MALKANLRDHFLADEKGGVLERVFKHPDWEENCGDRTLSDIWLRTGKRVSPWTYEGFRHIRDKLSSQRHSFPDDFGPELMRAIRWK